MEGNEEGRQRGCLQESEEKGGIGKVQAEWGCFGGRERTRVTGVKDAEGEMQQEGGIWSRGALWGFRANGTSVRPLREGVLGGGEQE